MSGPAFRDLISHLWTIAYTDVPRDERRRRYQVLIEQLEAHCGWSPDDRERPLHDAGYAKIHGWVEALLRLDRQ